LGNKKRIGVGADPLVTRGLKAELTGLSVSKHFIKTWLRFLSRSSRFLGQRYA